MLTAYTNASSPEERDRLFAWFGRSSEHLELARLEIIYSSVYGERWIIKGLGAIPEPLPNEAIE